MRYLLVFTSLILIVCLACSFLPVSGEEKVYDQVVRLHVIANSDSKEDQKLKEDLCAVLSARLDSLTRGAGSAEESAERLKNALPAITEWAREYLDSVGCLYEVSAVLTKDYYPSLTYEGVSLPAGVYTSLQVRIGRAEGHNWWCILFPQIAGSIAGTREEMKKTGFTPDQIQILTESESPRFKIKFRILELLSGTAPG